MQALRKALEPALSDISVDWFVPDAVEALLTPREIPALYPGDQLLGYCSLFRVDGFRSQPPGVGLGWGVVGGGPGIAEAPVSLQNPFPKKKKPKKKTNHFLFPVLLSAKLIYCYPLDFPRDQTGSLR